MGNLNGFHDMFFGVLDKEYCSIFYGLMLFMFLIVLSGIVSLLVYIVMAKNFSLPVVAFGILELLILSIGYMQQRMLYSMCIQI
jgi:hypothetical protein